MIQKYHWFVNFYIILSIILNAFAILLFIIGTVIKVFPTPFNYLFLWPFIGCALIIITMLLLLNKKKVGFWIYVAIETLAIVWAILAQSPIYIGIAILSVGILYAIFQIKKNGISAWRHLK